MDGLYTKELSYFPKVAGLSNFRCILEVSKEFITENFPCYSEIQLLKNIGLVDLFP
jgi:hypothetical protein